MSKEQFREIMGFVENQSSLYIVDKIFESLSEDNGVNVSHQITFVTFMEYMEKLVSGSQKEKTNLCFNMIDAKKVGFFTQNDLGSLVHSMSMNSPSSENGGVLVRKVNQITTYLFKRFDSRRIGKVTYEEFNDAILDDPQLLEIFTLLNKGIYEHFITKTLEEGRRHWFMNQTKYISMSLSESLNILDQQTNMRNFREATRQYLDSNFGLVKDAGLSPEHDMTQLQLQKVRSVNSLMETSLEKGGILVPPLQSSINCTPGIFVEREKKKKHSKLDHSSKKYAESLYEPNPIQEIEIIAEEMRADHLIRGMNNSKRIPSPDNHHHVIQSLGRHLPLNHMGIEELEGNPV